MTTPGGRSLCARTVALGLLLASTLAAGAAAEGRIYRWVDERGTPHFSDRPEEVPPAFRAQLGLPPSEPAEGGSAGAAAPRERSSDTEATPPWKRFGEGSAREVFEQMPRKVLLTGLLLFLGMAGIVVALGAVVLLVACRLVGQESPGFRKAYGIVIVQLLAAMVVGPGIVVVTGGAQASEGRLDLQSLNAGVTLLVNAAVLRGMLCESFGRALVIAVMVVVVSIALGIALAVGLLTCGVGGALLRSAG